MITTKETTHKLISELANLNRKKAVPIQDYSKNKELKSYPMPDFTTLNKQIKAIEKELSSRPLSLEKKNTH